MAIQGDSIEYELIEQAIKRYSPDLNTDYFLTLEIGVREGLSSKIIMDNFSKYHFNRPYYHIGIDPYGNLKYKHYDNKEAYTADYTNDMYEMCRKDFINYRNFFLLKITDKDYMKRFYSGFPVYENKKTLCTHYDLVHLDGPHTTLDVIHETIFFAARMKPKGIIIYDDYKTFDFSIIELVLKTCKFEKILAGQNKIIYEKT